MNVLKMFSLKGKVALMTGGAGKYGRQIVEALAESGAETYIASRNIDALEKVAAVHRERGEKVTALKLDQGSEDSINSVKDEIINRSGKCDILVNNAVLRCITNGFYSPMEEFDQSMRVNASGLFFITRVFADEMCKQKSGSIINIGSMMGMVGIEMANYEGTDLGKNPSPDYFFQKAGMINLTRFCASIYGKDNIRVNCVSPGGLGDGTQPDAFVKNYSARTQLGRMADSTDLKGIIVFLASEASAYITGANIPVDGGYTAK